MTNDQTNFGEVYTRPWIVEAMLDTVGYVEDVDLAAMALLEPSVGTGAFLLPAVKRLLSSAKKFGREFTTLASAIQSFDLLNASVKSARNSVIELLVSEGAATTDAEKLARKWVRQGDFLLVDDVAPADFVIGNPPYIRSEEVPDSQMENYRKSWPTMTGRSDIYVGFYERGLSALKPNGRLAYICADRWMRNQYGASLRAHISKNFAVDQIWVMHEVDAFESKVSAYPAITVLANSPQKDAVVVNTNASFNEKSLGDLQKRIREKPRTFIGTGFTGAKLHGWFTGRQFWPQGDAGLIALVEELNSRFMPLEDATTGTKVGIGIATGADAVYVVTAADIEADRLLPLAMTRDLKENGDLVWSGNYLVNPWDENGQLVNLSLYPKLESYLARYPKLKQRHTALNNSKDSWYRTIDKVKPELSAQRKLFIQDMRTSINPVLDNTGLYPHHNLYYLISKSWDLEVLGGLLISKICSSFIEAYAVKMRGGTLRFQSQYLRTIRVPKPESLSMELQARLRKSFRARDINGATEAAFEAYGLDKSYAWWDEGL